MQTKTTENFKKYLIFRKSVCRQAEAGGGSLFDVRSQRKGVPFPIFNLIAVLKGSGRNSSRLDG